jgi:hypothetical protein
MVLAAAGAVDHAELVKAAESAFGAVPDETPDTSVAALVAKVGWVGGWVVCSRLAAQLGRAAVGTVA